MQRTGSALTKAAFVATVWQRILGREASLTRVRRPTGRTGISSHYEAGWLAALAPISPPPANVDHACRHDVRSVAGIVAHRGGISEPRHGGLPSRQECHLAVVGVLDRRWGERRGRLVVTLVTFKRSFGKTLHILSLVGLF